MYLAIFSRFGALKSRNGITTHLFEKVAKMACFKGLKKLEKYHLVFGFSRKSIIFVV